jgi:hypothetical protein
VVSLRYSSIAWNERKRELYDASKRPSEEEEQEQERLWWIYGNT